MRSLCNVEKVIAILDQRGDPDGVEENRREDLS
jgi:hypothetical protein